MRYILAASDGQKIEFDSARIYRVDNDFDNDYRYLAKKGEVVLELFVEHGHDNLAVIIPDPTKAKGE